MIIRARSLKRWLQARFSPNELKYLTDCRVPPLWSGLYFNHQTKALYAKFDAEIWLILEDDAKDLGITPLKLIASLEQAATVETAYHLESLLVRYAARRIVQKLDNDRG